MRQNDALIGIEAKPMRPPHWSHDRQFFYKYATRSTGKIILRNRTLRWSAPRLFNDPFDIQFDLHVEIDRDRLKKRILHALWTAHYSETSPQPGNELGLIIALFRDRFPRFSRDEFDRAYSSAIDEAIDSLERNVELAQLKQREVLAGVKVLCVSEVSDNVLMWSHYAEQHTGVVFEFRCVPELDSALGAATPVSYLTQMPPLFDEDFLVRLGSGQESLDVRAIFNKAVHSKAAEWAYEKEWRLVGGRTGVEKDYEDIPFHVSELSSVIIGCRMPDTARLEFIELIAAHFPTVKIFQAKKHPKEFRLLIEEIPEIESR